MVGPGGRANGRVGGRVSGRAERNIGIVGMLATRCATADDEKGCIGRESGITTFRGMGKGSPKWLPIVIPSPPGP